MARVRAYFPDREIHVRSGDKLRFIRISSRLQVKVAAWSALALLIWLLITLAVTALQFSAANQRAALGQREAAVANRVGRVDAYRASLATAVDRVQRRQAMLDALVKQHFGDLEYGEAEPARGEPADRISAVIPEAAALARMERKQLAFANALETLVQRRTERAEAAIREFGLNPRLLGRQAMGGPYLPGAYANEAGTIDDQIGNLEIALNRLAAMELSLSAIPSARPTARLMVSSHFGLRADPFNGSRAMHTGLDIRGSHGQGIRATAGGRVVKAGMEGGYGMMIEIYHGAGMRTRYAHLSGVEVHVGERVDRGERIGRMGSTGRSTATHLHYEVRVNGRAINPRPFLEANPDVLEIQSIAERRNGDAVVSG